MICPNMRAAQIYVREPKPGLIEEMAKAILADSRVDQVIWRTGLTRPGRRLHRVRASRPHEFPRDAAAPSGRTYSAATGCMDWRPRRASRSNRTGGTILFSDYPNAFERIAGALELDESGEIWMTAKPGCEFEVPGGEAHVGGASHGALHALDSLSPVIIAGGGVRRRCHAICVRGHRAALHAAARHSDAVSRWRSSPVRPLRVILSATPRVRRSPAQEVRVWGGQQSVANLETLAIPRQAPTDACKRSRRGFPREGTSLMAVRPPRRYQNPRPR